MPAAIGSALGCWHRRADEKAYRSQKSCYCYNVTENAFSIFVHVWISELIKVLIRDLQKIQQIYYL